MSTATVRAQVANYFVTASIPGLNKVFGAPPNWADGSDWQLNLQQNSGAVAALHVVEETEKRLTLPVLTGSKMIHYSLGLMVFYQWINPQALTAPDEDGWNAPLDVILQGIKDRLRADPQCGIPQGAVWQAAQDDPDIVIRRDLPRQSPGKVFAWCVVEFNVYEIVNA